MKKILSLLGIVVVCAILAAIIVQNYAKTRLDSRICLLNESTCVIYLHDKSIEIQAIPQNIKPLEPITIRVQGEKFTKLEAKIYGINMDMGIIHTAFKPVSQDTYEVAIVMSACTMDTMQYQLELYDNGINLNAAIGFDIKKDTM